MQTINTLAPIFLTVLLGWILRRSGFLSEHFFKGMNRLVFWVALPALLFRMTARADYGGGVAFRISIVVVIGMLVAIASGWILVCLLRAPRTQHGTILQGAYRGNLAYVALPVIIYALAGIPGVDADRWGSVAVLAIAPVIPIYNIAAVILLQDWRSVSWSRVLMRVLVNPLVLACLAGGLYMMSGLPLPPAPDRTLETIGRMALPLALLGMGASLKGDVLRNCWKAALPPALVKTFVSPLTGILLLYFFPMGREVWLITMTYLACPTAVASYVMADQLEGDGKLACAIVLASTLCSAISLSLVVALA